MPYFELNNSEKSQWKSINEGYLKIRSQYFFNNANIILSHEKYFRQNIMNNLIGNIKIDTKIRNSKGEIYKGIDIAKFNKELRKNLSQDSKLIFEIYNEDGVFYTSNQKKGFDFGYLDNKYNLIQLWNLCFGKRGLHNGQSHWEKSLKSNRFFERTAEEIDFKTEYFQKGISCDSDKQILTILGELQFGNWGLIYRDLFKLLHADANSGVDLFVYVVADGDLLNYASEGIVTFEKTVNILNEFASLVKVPVWVIGLDIEIL